MTTIKPASGASRPQVGFESTTAEKIAPPQSDKPTKPVRRRIPKALRPRVVGDAPVAPAPVILWDDPFEPAPDPKARG
jgi:hypothetical protein